MTTSEPGKGERRPAKETKYELPWLGPGASAEFLDIASLTRLANEFMRALPDSSDKALANTVDTTTLKGQLATSNQHIPSEAELRQLPFTLSGSLRICRQPSLSQLWCRKERRCSPRPSNPLLLLAYQRGRISPTSRLPFSAIYARWSAPCRHRPRCPQTGLPAAPESQTA